MKTLSDVKCECGHSVELHHQETHFNEVGCDKCKCGVHPVQVLLTTIAELEAIAEAMARCLYKYDNDNDEEKALRAFEEWKEK